jgi:hypothetical protein
MTKAEKNRLSTVIRATEYLFLENIALKLVLEHRAGRGRTQVSYQGIASAIPQFS